MIFFFISKDVLKEEFFTFGTSKIGQSSEILHNLARKSGPTKGDLTDNPLKR